MRSIEVKTTQNVTISYELAAARDRIFAFLIDLIVKGIVAFVLIILWGLLPYSFRNSTEEFFVFMVYLPLMFFSWLVMEVKMNGQTFGKKALRIKVIKLNGKNPDFYDYLLRWCFRIVDVYSSLGIPAVVLVSSTNYAQRLGDMVANTTVVRVKSQINVTLNDVLKIESRSNYTPKYEAIRHFSEEDILLLKSTLERYQKYPNEAHRAIVLDLARSMKDKLKIDDDISDAIPFLRGLIKDYIVLTR